MCLQAHSKETDRFLDNSCFAMSMNFSMCQLTALLPPLLRKARIVFPSFQRNTTNTLKAIEKYKCQSLVAAPKHLLDIFAHPDLKRFDMSSLRFVMSGSQIVSSELVKRSFEIWGLEYFVVIYGMTEIKAAAFKRIDDPIQCGGLAQLAVGRPIGLYEFKIVDFESSSGSSPKLVPFGCPGELWVKGAYVMNGYWDDPEKTKEALGSDGW